MTGQYIIIVELLRAFYWYDDGLQNYLRAKGWPEVSRTQSMTLMNIMTGVDRPSAIARNLGISRQAIHITLSQMIEANMLRLEPDPDDARGKRVVLSKELEPMRRDARDAVDCITDELAKRVGRRQVTALMNIVSQDWGPVLDFDTQGNVEESNDKVSARRRRARRNQG